MKYSQRGDRKTVERERGETVELGEDGEPVAMSTTISYPEPTERIKEIHQNMQMKN